MPLAQAWLALAVTRARKRELMVLPSAPILERSDPQAEILAFLGGGGAFSNGAPPRRIDTHAASIFLSGERAWKLKRAVRFDYLDFSTPALRRTALDAELRLNRRTAPELYRAINSVARDPAGRLAVDGEGDAVDWLLEMQRFPDDALFSIRADAGLLSTRLLVRLADRISSFHAGSAIVVVADGAARFQRVIDGNTASMTAFPAVLGLAKVARLGTRLIETASRLAALLDVRGASGRCRHVHGDLHLANIALIDGEPTLFDCLEFDANLASIDVLCDLAFLLMDLWQRGLRTEANIVFNRYLDVSPADENGIALLPLFLAVRATIRAHVLAAQSARSGSNISLIQQARDYLDLATDLPEPVTPRSIAIGGFSGTGKSTLARALGGEFGRAPGARVLRSDVLRKRLAGIALEMPLPAAFYTPDNSVEVYTKLGEMATGVLACGHAMIADAVFGRRAERDAIATVASKASVSFDGFWLEASDISLVDRLASRGPDASDADASVASLQSKLDIGELGNWRTVSASSSPAKVAAEVRALLATDP